MDDNIQTSFGKRLKFAMIQMGFSSSRSPHGVDVARLAEITKHSPQICRKYLNNTSLPGIETIILLSEALSVNPGWLLFGEAPSRNNDLISLPPALLRFILEEGVTVQAHFKSNHDFADFLMHIIGKINEFDLPELQIKRIVQCMITYVKCLNRS